MPDPVLSTRHIYVGNPSLFEDLAREVSMHIPDCSNVVKLDPSYKEEPSHKVFFIRDQQVVLHDGSHLIPACIDDHLLLLKVQTLLHPLQQHFLKPLTGCYGTGFTNESRAKALETCEKLGIPFILGRTAIEGGNCHLFFGKDGMSRAIIGLNSLIISYIALDDQGFFEENEFELGTFRSTIKTPTDESLLVARNNELRISLLAIQTRLEELYIIQKDITTPDSIKSDIYKQASKLRATLEELQKDLLVPLTLEDRVHYKNLAIAYEARVQLTKSLISKELKVPLNNIAFVFQNHFHIDLDLLVTSEGNVCFHDETKSKKLLADELPKAGDHHRTLLTQYINASDRMPCADETTKLNEKLLSSIGCKTFAVPGSYRAPGEETLNFMNGITLLKSSNETFFLTNGAPDKYYSLKLAFKNAVEACSPATTVVFFDDNTSTLTTLLTKNEGGLRCITWVR